MERPGRAHLEVDGDRLLLYVPEGTDVDARLKLLQDWQRKQLQLAVPPLLARWQPVIGREVPRWSVRRMKTKWGSCNRETGSTPPSVGGGFESVPFVQCASRGRR